MSDYVKHIAMFGLLTTGVAAYSWGFEPVGIFWICMAANLATKELIK